MGHGHRRRVLIYVSGGGNEGMGHVIRSSHLANALRERADVCLAYSVDHSDLIPDWMRCERLPVEMDPLRQANPVHVATINGFGPDIFVLDVMWPRDDWMCAPKNVLIVGAGWAITKKIAEAAQLLVYQTGWEMERKKSLSGPEYLMLGPRYGQRPRRKTNSVLVSFGAGIPKDFARDCCENLSGATRPESGEMLYGLQASSRIHAGSMGMSTYESMSQGCVPVVICRSTDHSETAEQMDRLGCAVNCGIITGSRAALIVPICRDLLLDERRLSLMAQNGMDLIDGKGLARVAERILSV